MASVLSSNESKFDWSLSWRTVLSLGSAVVIAGLGIVLLGPFWVNLAQTGTTIGSIAMMMVGVVTSLHLAIFLLCGFYAFSRHDSSYLFEVVLHMVCGFAVSAMVSVFGTVLILIKNADGLAFFFSVITLTVIPVSLWLGMRSGRAPVEAPGAKPSSA